MVLRQEEDRRDCVRVFGVCFAIYASGREADLGSVDADDEWSLKGRGHSETAFC